MLWVRGSNKVLLPVEPEFERLWEGRGFPRASTAQGLGLGAARSQHSKTPVPWVLPPLRPSPASPCKPEWGTWVSLGLLPSPLRG